MMINEDDALLLCCPRVEDQPSREPKTGRAATSDGPDDICTNRVRSDVGIADERSRLDMIA